MRWLRGKYYPDTAAQTNNNFRNRDAKILKETLEKPIQKYIKRTVHHDKMGFIPRMQSWLNIQELVNIKHHTKKIKGENT